MKDIVNTFDDMKSDDLKERIECGGLNVVWINYFTVSMTVQDGRIQTLQFVSTTVSNNNVQIA
jgi:hypothetical protein